MTNLRKGAFEQTLKEARQGPMQHLGSSFEAKERESAKALW